jgi:hypothetical protein
MHQPPCITCKAEQHGTYEYEKPALTPPLSFPSLGLPFQQLYGPLQPPSSGLLCLKTAGPVHRAGWGTVVLPFSPYPSLLPAKDLLNRSRRGNVRKGLQVEVKVGTTIERS